MTVQAGTFVWYELTTTDLAAARTFYAAVAGWDLADSGMPGVDYTLASVGGIRIGGLMAMPDTVRAAGVSPGWVGYIAVADVDAAAEQVRQAGGGIHRAPDDIPGIGRLSVAADPQGAVFVLFRGNGEAPAAPPPGTPGHVGWHELHARDWEPAFAFYEALFGWRKRMAVDMGPMGTYQLFGTEEADTGGMMSAPQVPAPHWLYYVTVDDIDAGAARVAGAGGAVRSGPHRVPGGNWIVQVSDPQGAAFALVGPRAAG